MPCYAPIQAWQTDDGAVVFVERGSIRRALTLPCGRCIGCRLERSRQWAVRCMHEASCYDSNCFVTLTYAPDKLPDGGDLVYWHFQDFMKRLRKRMGKCRFYMCGEYGEQLGRPHFHACLFGISFPDLVLWSEGSEPKYNLYTSKILSSLWTDGFASVGQLSFESAAYVARYVMKKAIGESATRPLEKLCLETGEVLPKTREFNRMSLKPGIGAPWLKKWKTDVYPRDFVVVNGSEAKPPRYYDKYLTVLDPELSEFMEVVRYAKLDMVDPNDCTDERLRVRESVTRARLRLRSRSLE